MLSPVQQIILTCLLGPEDKTAFSRFQKNAKERERVGRNPEKNRLKRRENQRRYSAKFPDRVKESCRKSQKKRYDSNPQFRVSIALRTRLTRSLVREGIKKSVSTFNLLGCPLAWLEVHLESLFKPGMTWQNYGPVWHIDHIKPCAKFDLTDPEQQKICFHWTNLQPLFAEENLKKGDTYV